MSDPTPDAPARRRWPFTYVQVRLGILMTALVFGLSGMVRNDARLIDVGIAVALVGVVMRFLNRKKKGA
jgi:uncharacterized membrane protein